MMPQQIPAPNDHPNIMKAISASRSESHSQHSSSHSHAESIDQEMMDDEGWTRSSSLSIFSPSAIPTAETSTDYQHQHSNNFNTSNRTNSTRTNSSMKPSDLEDAWDSSHNDLMTVGTTSLSSSSLRRGVGNNNHSNSNSRAGNMNGIKNEHSNSWDAVGQQLETSFRSHASHNNSSRSLVSQTRSQASHTSNSFNGGGGGGGRSFHSANNAGGAGAGTSNSTAPFSLQREMMMLDQQQQSSGNSNGKITRMIPLDGTGRAIRRNSKQSMCSADVSVDTSKSSVKFNYQDLYECTEDEIFQQEYQKREQRQGRRATRRNSKVASHLKEASELLTGSAAPTPVARGGSGSADDNRSSAQRGYNSVVEGNKTCLIKEIPTSFSENMGRGSASVPMRHSFSSERSGTGNYSGYESSGAGSMVSVNVYNSSKENSAQNSLVGGSPGAEDILSSGSNSLDVSEENRRLKFTRGHQASIVSSVAESIKQLIGSLDNEQLQKQMIQKYPKNEEYSDDESVSVSSEEEALPLSSYQHQPALHLQQEQLQQRLSEEMESLNSDVLFNELLEAGGESSSSDSSSSSSQNSSYSNDDGMERSQSLRGIGDQNEQLDEESSERSERSQSNLEEMMEKAIMSRQGFSDVGNEEAGEEEQEEQDQQHQDRNKIDDNDVEDRPRWARNMWQPKTNLVERQNNRPLFGRKNNNDSVKSLGNSSGGGSNDIDEQINEGEQRPNMADEPKSESQKSFQSWGSQNGERQPFWRRREHNSEDDEGGSHTTGDNRAPLWRRRGNREDHEDEGSLASSQSKLSQKGDSRAPLWLRRGNREDEGDETGSLASSQSKSQKGDRAPFWRRRGNGEDEQHNNNNMANTLQKSTSHSSLPESSLQPGERQPFWRRRGNNNNNRMSNSLNSCPSKEAQSLAETDSFTGSDMLSSQKMPSLKELTQSLEDMGYTEEGDGDEEQDDLTPSTTTGSNSSQSSPSEASMSQAQQDKVPLFSRFRRFNDQQVEEDGHDSEGSTLSERGGPSASADHIMEKSALENSIEFSRSGRSNDQVEEDGNDPEGNILSKQDDPSAPADDLEKGALENSVFLSRFRRFNDQIEEDGNNDPEGSILSEQDDPSASADDLEKGALENSIEADIDHTSPVEGITPKSSTSQRSHSPPQNTDQPSQEGKEEEAAQDLQVLPGQQGYLPAHLSIAESLTGPEEKIIVHMEALLKHNNEVNDQSGSKEDDASSESELSRFRPSLVNDFNIANDRDSFHRRISESQSSRQGSPSNTVDWPSPVSSIGSPPTVPKAMLDYGDESKSGCAASADPGPGPRSSNASAADSKEDLILSIKHESLNDNSKCDDDALEELYSDYAGSEVEMNSIDLALMDIEAKDNLCLYNSMTMSEKHEDDKTFHCKQAQTMNAGESSERISQIGSSAAGSSKPEDATKSKLVNPTPELPIKNDTENHAPSSPTSSNETDNEKHVLGNATEVSKNMSSQAQGQVYPYLGDEESLDALDFGDDCEDDNLGSSVVWAPLDSSQSTFGDAIQKTSAAKQIIREYKGDPLSVHLRRRSRGSRSLSASDNTLRTNESLSSRRSGPGVPEDNSTKSGDKASASGFARSHNVVDDVPHSSWTQRVAVQVPTFRDDEEGDLSESQGISFRSGNGFHATRRGTGNFSEVSSLDSFASPIFRATMRQDSFSSLDSLASPTHGMVRKKAEPEVKTEKQFEQTYGEVDDKGLFTESFMEKCKIDEVKHAQNTFQGGIAPDEDGALHHNPPQLVVRDEAESDDPLNHSPRQLMNDGESGTDGALHHSHDSGHDHLTGKDECDADHLLHPSPNHLSPLQSREKDESDRDDVLHHSLHDLILNDESNDDELHRSPRHLMERDDISQGLMMSRKKNSFHLKRTTSDHSISANDSDLQHSSHHSMEKDDLSQGSMGIHLKRRTSDCSISLGDLSELIGDNSGEHKSESSLVASGLANDVALHLEHSTKSMNTYFSSDGIDHIDPSATDESRDDFDFAMKAHADAMKCGHFDFNGSSAMDDNIAWEGNDMILAARAYMGLGFARQCKGELESSLDAYTKALHLWEEEMGQDGPMNASVQYTIGTVLIEMQRQLDASSYFTKALRLFKHKSPADSGNRASILSTEGMLFSVLGETNRAIECFQQAVLMYQNPEQSMNLKFATVMFELGSLLSQQGHYDDSTNFFNFALEIRKALIGDSFLVARTHYSLGVTKASQELKSNKDMGSASHLEEALRICQDEFEDEHLQSAIIVHALGVLNERKGDFLTASVWFAKERNMRKLLFGEDHDSVIAVSNDLGTCYYNSGKYDLAISTFEDGLRIILLAENDRSLEVAEALYKVASCHDSLCNYDEALEKFHEVKKIRESLFGMESSPVIQTMLRIGNIQLCKGEVKKALDCFSEVLGIGYASDSVNAVEVANALYGRGCAQFCGFHMADAMKSFNESLNWKLAALGEDDPGLACIFYQMAHVYIEQNEPEEAITFLETYARLQKLEPQRNLHDNAEICYAEGIVAKLKGKQDAALWYYQQALTMFDTLFGGEHEKVASVHFDIGCVHSAMRNYEAALNHFQTSLLQRRKLLGGHVDVANALYEMASIYCEQNSTQLAVKCLTESDRIWKAKLRNNEKLTSVLLLSAKLWKSLQCYQAAEENFEQALEQAITIYGQEHESVASILLSLGELLQEINQIEQALFCFSESIQVRTALHGPDSPSVAQVEYSKGVALIFHGDFKEASTCLYRALAIRQEKLGPMDGAVGDTLNTLGFLKLRLGNIFGDEALDPLQKALEIRRAVGNKSKVVSTLQNIASVYKKRKQYDSCMEIHAEILSVRQEEFGTSDERVAEAWINLGNIQTSAGRLVEATVSYEEALRVRTLINGYSHISVARVLFKIGSLNSRQNNYADAKQLFEEYMRIRAEEEDDPDEEMAQALTLMGDLQKETGEKSKAAINWMSALEVYQQLGYPDGHPKMTKLRARQRTAPFGYSSRKSVSDFSVMSFFGGGSLAGG